MRGLDSIIDKYVLPITLCMISLLIGVACLLGAIYVPHAMYAQSVCLAKGYPEGYVTFDFKIYCISPNGTVVATE